MRIIAKTISLVFQPLLIPLIGIILLYSFVDYFTLLPLEVSKVIFYVIILGTFLLPLSFFPLYFYFKIIDSIEMDNKNERIIPLLITLIFYYLSWRNLNIPHIPLIIKNICLGAMISVLLSGLISFFYKISVHMTGVGGLVGLCVALVFVYNVYSMPLIIISLIIAGITGFARLKLNAHKPHEVYTGFTSGFLVMFWILYLL